MTDTTLAERLARCVKPLKWHPTAKGWMRAEGFGCEYHAEEGGDTCRAEEGHRARILAALDMDALAQEVEAMVDAAVEADRAEFKCGECDLPSYLCEARCFVRNAIKVHGEEKTWESVKEYFPAIRAREGWKP
jgi:hypothetical protein